MDNASAVTWAKEKIVEAERSGFYGKLIFEFKAGKIFLVRMEQTELPPAREPQTEDKENAD